MPRICKQESGSTQLGVLTRGRFQLKPRHCPLSLSLLPITNPRPRERTKTSRRRPYNSAAAPSSSVPNTFKQESASHQVGLPTRGRFHLNPYNCTLPLSSTRHPPKTPLLHQNESPSAAVTALSSSVPNACKKESGSTQLGVPTMGRYHLKPRHCPQALTHTCHPPKTPLIHQDESSAVQQRYGSTFVHA